MQVITVTREYGAGGGEVAKRLAEVLGWELLDRELLHQAEAVEHVPDADLERLDEKALSVADRFRLHPPHHQYMHGLTEAAARGVDIPERIEPLLAALEGMIGEGLVTVDDVRIMKFLPDPKPSR